MPDAQVFTLPAGAVCNRGGVPFVLHVAAQIECHPENWPLIQEGFKPSINGQALECSQSLQGLDMPCVAQPCATNDATSNSSLESSTGCNKSRI